MNIWLLKCLLLASVVMVEAALAQDGESAETEMSNEAVTDGASAWYAGAGLGWPHILQVGIQFDMGDGLRPGLDVGYTTWNTSGTGVTDRITLIALRADYSLGGGLYTGGSLGYKMTSSTKEEALSEPAGFTLEAKTETTAVTITPYAGYIWMTGAAWELSTEIGVEYAAWYEMEFSSNATGLNTAQRQTVYTSDEYADARSDVRDHGNRLGRSVAYARLVNLNYRL